MTSKSNVLSPSCIIVAMLCGITMNSFLIRSVGSTASYKEMEIIDDLPVKSNLEKYLLSLEKIVYFVNSHRVYVDMNLELGLFLAGVNLRSTLQMRGHRLTAQKRVRFERILKTIDEIQKYFHKMVGKFVERSDAIDEAPISIAFLLVNESFWPSHMKSLNIELLKKTKFYSRKELELKYFKWSIYKAKIFGTNDSHPTPSESDTCLDLLSQNPSNDKAKLVHCQVPYDCARLITNGSHYGYSITHRILFLLMARFSRGCALLTPAEDSDMLESLCATAYNEAEFIAYHDFELADLFIEIVFLCSLDGHAQFLRRSWLEEMMDYQSVLGCFNLTRPGAEEDRESKVEATYGSFSWQLIITDLTVMGGACNVHATAVAAGMMSAAVRYILENYY